jgi:hypothetical protein
VEPSVRRASSTELDIRTSAPSDSPRRFDAAVARTQARDALVGLGWKPVVARAAVDEAIAACGSGLSLEVLIRESLRRCPLTRGG